MEIVVTQAQGRKPVTVFRIVGTVDSSNYVELENKAREAFEAGARDLLLDLKDMGYISSGGIRTLGVISKLLDSADPQGGGRVSPHLKLINVPDRVIEVFQISGADIMLAIHADPDTAIQSF